MRLTEERQALRTLAPALITATLNAAQAELVALEGTLAKAQVHLDVSMLALAGLASADRLTGGQQRTVAAAKRAAAVLARADDGLMAAGEKAACSATVRHARCPDRTLQEPGSERSAKTILPPRRAQCRSRIVSPLACSGRDELRGRLCA